MRRSAARRTYNITAEELETLMLACHAGRRSEAWAVLGSKYGFDFCTVKQSMVVGNPDPCRFTAIPMNKERHYHEK